MRARLPILLAIVFIVSFVAGGRALGQDTSKTGNLDSDPALEKVVARQLCEATDGTLQLAQPECGADQFPRRRIEIEDTCGGKSYRRPISSVQDFVDVLRLVNAVGSAARQEVFFDLRSGATGRGGDIRLVRYGGGGSCPTPHSIFHYPTSKTIGPVPRGASGHDSFSVSLGNYSDRYRGREIRVVETYIDRDDAYCCPTFKRTTHFRFAGKRDTYVRYRTQVKRLKK
jgi:hypothetical protein